MVLLGRWTFFVISLICAFSGALSESAMELNALDQYTLLTTTPSSSVEIPGGRVTNRKMNLPRGSYVLREDLIVERDGELNIEPGVEIRVSPMVGITVRGVITAKVSEF